MIRVINQYNLSDYAGYLLNGGNEQVLELINESNKEMKLDYGLKAF